MDILPDSAHVDNDGASLRAAILGAAAADTRLSGAALRVLAQMLTQHAAGACEVEAPAIADAVHLADKTVYACLSTLERYGYVAPRIEYRPGRRGRPPRRYCLRTPRDRRRTPASA